MAAEKKTEEGQLPDLEAPKSQIVSRDEVSNFCGRKKYGFVGGICIYAYVCDNVRSEFPKVCKIFFYTGHFSTIS